MAKIPVLGILTHIGLAFIIIIDYGVHSMDSWSIESETYYNFDQIQEFAISMSRDDTHCQYY